jgi:hypothetical protein
MQSSGLSLLAPRLMVYNSSLRPVVANYSNTFGGTVSVTVPNVQPGQGFYLRLGQGNTTYYNDTGAYALQLNFGSGTMSPVAPPNTSVPYAFNQGQSVTSETLPTNPNGPTHGPASAPGLMNGHGKGLEQVLEHVFGYTRGPANKVPGSHGLSFDATTGLLAVGNFTGHGDVLTTSSLTDSATPPKSDPSGSWLTTQTVQTDAAFLAFLADFDAFSTSDKSKKASRGRND